MAVFGILLLVSVSFNILQYNKKQMTEEKLLKLESEITNLKLENNAVKMRESIITINMQPHALESQINTIKKLLESQKAVQSVQRLPSEEVLAEYKSANRNNPLILRSLQEVGNPFGARLMIRLTDPTQKQNLIRLIEDNSTSNGIRAVE